MTGIVVSLVGVFGAVLVGSAAQASTLITQIGSLAGQTNSGEFMVTGQLSDDGNIVVFRSSDPALVAAFPNGYRPPQLFVWRRATGTVEQISVSVDGVKGNSYVTEFSLSGDGRFVVFAGTATNLGPACVGQQPCLFRKDLVSGAVISAAPGLFSNPPGGIGSFANQPSTSTDGRFALYRTSVVDGVALSDLTAGTTTRVTRTSLTGDIPVGPVSTAGGGSYNFLHQTISDGGRYIVVSGYDGPPGSRTDLYLVDTVTNVSRRITRAVGGGFANSSSKLVQLTPDGSTVLFSSGATNLTADAVGGVFAYDVATATTRLVSIGADGQPMTSVTGQAITDDGRYVFLSDPMTVRDLTTGVSRRITDQGSQAPFVGLRGNFDIAGDGATIVGAGTTGPQVDLNPTHGGLYVFDGYTALAVDHTPPVVTGSPGRAPDLAGWYRSPVTITWSSSDPSPSSGSPTIPTPFVVSAQGADQVISAESCDPAGNCGTAQVTVSVDQTAPTVVIGGVVAGATYDRDAVPEPTCWATDGLSGLAAVCSVTVDGGNPDGSGTFRVVARAQDVAGNNGQATLTYTVETAQVPATPLLASIVMGNHTATITWLKPDDGGNPILGYTVTATPGGQTCSTEGPDALSCTINALTNGVNYTFTVTARNAVGTSPQPDAGGGTGPGTPTGSGTPGTPPGPVPGVEPIPDPADGSRVTLHWLPAASELPIVGYRAFAEPGGQFCTTDGALSCTITGLTPGQHYSFTVIAINGIGSSDPSDPVSLPPTVTALAPSQGTSVGGTVVTISGNHFDSVTAVYFGDAAATFTPNLDGSITATSPAHAPGVVDVRIITPAGSSAATAADRFTYTASADLATTATPAAGPVAIGDSVVQTIVVTNHGPDTTQANTTITVSGTGHTVLSAAPTSGSCSTTGSTMDCSLGTLLSGASAIVAITIEPNATGPIDVSATSTGSEADPTPGNNAGSVTIDATNAHGCTIVGTSGNDTLAGTNGTDVICALAGDDHVTGGNGNDIIYGGSGHDTLDGGNGDDILYAGNTGSLLLGGNGDDILTGGAGNDTIHGGNGNDTINAGAGTDTIDGGNGNDTINAGDGTDAVDGGNGNDTCAGTEQAISCTG